MIVADIKSREKRSRNMAAIKGKDTKPEVYLRGLLFRHGYRFRKNTSLITGHPDIWMRKYNVAIFINGCFWHRHEGCKYAYKPKSNIEFWQRKFQLNVIRDQKVRDELKSKKVRCIIVWECTIREMRKNKALEEEYFKKLEKLILQNNLYAEL